jgi:hypothetical protein
MNSEEDSWVFNLRGDHQGPGNAENGEKTVDGTAWGKYIEEGEKIL